MTPASCHLTRLKGVLAAVAVSLAASLPCKAEEPLRPSAPIVLEGTHGKFDFLAIDRGRRRLLAAHTGNASLDIIDLEHRKLLKSVPTGAAQAAAVDPQGGMYLVAVSKPPQVALVDATSLEVAATVALPGPADLIAFHAGSKLAFVDHDDAREVWMVDVQKRKLIGSVALPGDSPEDLGFDSTQKRLLQCMKNGNVVAVVDLDGRKVLTSWPTAPASAPHGMAFLPEEHAFVVAGGNGKLVLMSESEGRVLGSIDIPSRVDQIACDPALHRIYCASGAGTIGIVGLDHGKLSPLGAEPSHEGCHSIAVDPETHEVWIAYAQGERSFVQAFAPAQR